MLLRHPRSEIIPCIKNGRLKRLLLNSSHHLNRLYHSQATYLQLWISFKTTQKTKKK